jgi:hypothetical protein
VTVAADLLIAKGKILRRGLRYPRKHAVRGLTRAGSVRAFTGFLPSAVYHGDAPMIWACNSYGINMYVVSVLDNGDLRTFVSASLKVLDRVVYAMIGGSEKRFLLSQVVDIVPVGTAPSRVAAKVAADAAAPRMVTTQLQ